MKADGEEGHACCYHSNGGLLKIEKGFFSLKYFYAIECVGTYLLLKEFNTDPECKWVQRQNKTV